MGFVKRGSPVNWVQGLGRRPRRVGTFQVAKMWSASLPLEIRDIILYPSWEELPSASSFVHSFIHSCMHAGMHLFHLWWRSGTWSLTLSFFSFLHSALSRQSVPSFREQPGAFSRDSIVVWSWSLVHKRSWEGQAPPSCQECGSFTPVKDLPYPRPYPWYSIVHSLVKILWFRSYLKSGFFCLCSGLWHPPVQFQSQYASVSSLLRADAKIF